MSNSSYQGPTTHGGDAGIRGLSAQQASLFEKQKKKNRRQQGQAGGSWAHEVEEEEEETPHPPPAAAAPPPRAKVNYGALVPGPEGQTEDDEEKLEEDEEGVAQAYAHPTGETVKPKHDSTLEASLEWRLVEKLTRPGGVRSQPTDTELTDFCIKSEQLAWKQVARSLYVKLDDSNWVVRLKAMAGLLALLERGRPKGVKKYCKKHPDALVGESQSDQKALRRAALAVCDLVFDDLSSRPQGRAPLSVGSSSQRPARPAATSSAPPPAKSGDILAFLDEPVPASAAPVAVAPTAVDPTANALASLNLTAPTLQAGTTFVPQQPIAMAYPMGQPMYSQQYPPQQYAPQQYPPQYTQPYQQPYQQPGYGTQQYSPVRTPPVVTQPAQPQADSFNFVQDAMKTAK
jgi:hypothetical protein